MNLKKEKRSIFESLSKIVFNTSIVLMLFFVFSVGDAHATVPTITTAKVTGPNQITVVYNTAVTSASADYTDFQGGLSSCTSDSVSGSSTNTIIITLGTCSLGTDAIGTMDIGTGVTSVDTGTSLSAINDSSVADGQVPTATVAINDTMLSDSETATVTIVFSEMVTDFDNLAAGGFDNITTIQSGSLGDFSNQGGTTWTSTFTPTDDIEATSSVITLDMTTIHDSAGNQGVGTEDCNAYDVDTLEPTFTAERIDMNTINLTFSENFDVSGNEPTAWLVSDGATVVSAINPGGRILKITTTGLTGTDETPTVTYVAANGTDVDGAGNEVIDGTNAIASDKAAPVIVDFTYLDNSGNGKIDGINVVFSEDVVASSELAANDLSLANSGDFTGASFGSLSTDLITGQVGSINVPLGTAATVVDTSEDSGSIAINVVGTITLTDVLGNSHPISGVSPNNAIFSDGANPIATTVSIASDGNDPSYAKVGDIVTLTVVTSEDVKNEIATIDGNLCTIVPGADNQHWTATYPMQSGDTEGVYLTYSLDFDDISNNSATHITNVTDGSHVVFDETPPTASITLDNYAIGGGATTTVTFTFSEAPSNFGNADVSVESGSIDTLVLDGMSMGKIYTATFTPAIGVEDVTNTISVGVNWEDRAGNVPVGVTNSANYTVDTLAPTFTATRTATDTIVLTFSEPVSASDAATSAWTLNYGSVSSVTQPSATTTLTITTTGITGTNENPRVTYVAASGSVVDGAGNEVTDGTNAVSSDRVVPTFTATRTAIDTIILTFSEAVSASDTATSAWTLDQGSVSSVTQPSSEMTLTITTTGLTGTDETPTVTYHAGSGTVMDGSNNEVNNSAQATAGDGVAPIINAFIYHDNDQDGMIDMINIHFSENVVNSSVISANDLIFTNVGDFTGAEFGNDTTDLITVTGNNVDVPLGTEATVVDTGENSGNIAISSQNLFSLKDVAGNVNSALTPQSQATFYDYVYPIFTAERTATDTIVLTFSEPISASDAATSAWTLDQGSVNSVTQPSNEITLTITTTGITGSDETPVVTYVDASGTVTDGASNEVDNGTHATASDGIAPTADLTYSDSDKVFESGQNVTITATFNEPMADNPVVKLALDNSELSATAMTKASTTVYTYNYTVQSSSNISTVTASLSVGEDGAGNVITAVPTSGATFEIRNPSSGGGGGGGTSYCRLVEFDAWQETCVNGLQYRNIVSKSPANCTFTSSQQADRSRVCGQEVETDKKEPKEIKKEVEAKKENTDHLLDGVLSAFINSEKALLKVIDKNLAKRLSGKILLQVEGHGEAWYVNPTNQNRYFLGRPADAFGIMRQLGLGVSEADFSSFGEYAPARLAGKILLRVENHGEAYYVSPVDNKMYYLGRPADAFSVMKNLGLGITNNNIRKINID